MITKMNDSQDPLDEALEWHLRLLSEAANEDDWHAFELWLSAESGHRKAYDRVEAAWIEVESGAQLARQSAGASLGSTDRLNDPASGRAAKSSKMGLAVPRRWAAMAAGILVTVTAGWLFYLHQAQGVTYETAKGQTRTIVLADGTTIRLNTASTLSVKLEKDVRRVTMSDAEASFDVAKDPRRPFIVTISDRQVRVVGTEFNILHYNGQLTVTLRRGAIEVVPVGAAGASDVVRLVPGQELRHKDGQSLSSVRQVNPDTAFAWHSGHLIYHDTSLGNVVSDLNRYFSIPIRADQSVSALKFSGVLTTDTEDAVVHRLEAFLPVAAERSPSAITFHRRPKN